MEKYQNFFILKFSVFGGKFSIYLNRRVFVMYITNNTQITETLTYTGLIRMLHYVVVH